MRAGVWSAAALLLLAVATTALRTAQVEGVRNSRRLSNFDSRGSTSTEKIDDAQPTFRSRSYRRREETASPAPRDITRSKSRNRVSESLTSNAVTEQSPTENGRNERFDSRRTNRIRSRPTENQKAVTTFPSRDTTVNNKARQSNRRAQYTTTTVSTSAPSSSVTSDIRRDVNRRAQTTTTEAVTILSSPTLDEFKSEITASTFDDFTRTVPKEEDITTVQFKRRSTTAKSVEVETPINTKAARTRGRVITKTNIKLDDMASSDATNVLSISENNLTSEKSSEDARKSRKLRYRTRLSETDTNLTGEGITASNEIIKTSRKQQKQPESKTTTLAPTERKVQRNVERNSSKSSVVKSMRVVRRPLSRGNENGTTIPKVKTSDEVGDDDNYPASFKALIQAKNASTQVSSPPSESLSVKATHTAINTNTKPSLPSNTSIESNSITRLRSKLNTTENDIKNGDEKLSESPLDSPKPKSQEYKLRGTYSVRPRKLKTENVRTTTTTSSPNLAKSPYKFTRKLRTTTSSPVDIKSSESPRKFKRFESGQSPQTASGPLYARKKIANNINKPAEAVTNDNGRDNLSSSVSNNSVKLPRTSYYSRLRNNAKNGITTTESPNTDINNPFKVDKKTENTAEMPLIYTMVNKPTKTVSEESKSDTKDEFLLAVSSKESQENNLENELVTNAEESENMPVINVFSTTQKYHANYKDQSLGSDRQKNEYVVTAATPAIRNIQTRKYTRKIFKSKEKVESTSINPVSKSKERALRKYSDTFSKTTEASTNGITSDPEKPKSRFSSKYRASNLDKAFYKPTVPTVTTTTEVGEEILLGPDMNAISFTQTRSALSSADLRLSESLEKPSHVMNVEASNHSPSVTVSIFDALAEILTSTPRIQISTTTDVPQQTFTDSVVKQTLNSVSSNNNVNSVSDFASQGTSTSTESLTTITTVQNTDQTTPTVLNRLSVEESVSPSLNIKENTMSTNNPQTTPTPTPTTPISARRPFAIKVLYSDTERPTDVPMTSSEPTTKWSTTENSKMVYNTVSDLILSNNNLVSSELTSMLSNNIKDIIENLDEESRSRLSVDMAKLLKTLIPRVVNKNPSLNDLDNIPNTTPYSLEDIKDTENIDIGNVVINTNENLNIDSKNFLQNVQDINVNITQGTTESPLSDAIINDSVNSISGSVLSTVLPLSESETTVADIVATTDTININLLQTLDSSSTILTTTPTNLLPINIEIPDTATLSSLEMSTAVVDNLSVDTTKTPTVVPTNNPLPITFSSNLKVGESISSDTNKLSLINKFDNRVGTEDFDSIDIDDPSQITRFQLWVLSKKARVLKMIEQLIREHNDEIANGPLTEVFNQSNNITLSNRLTQIINTMDSTTLSNPNTDITTDLVVTTPITSTSNPSSDLSESVNILNDRSEADFTTPPTTILSDVLLSTIPDSTEVDSTTDVTEVTATTIANEIADAFLRANANAIDQTTVKETTNDENETTIAENEKENIISTTENAEIGDEVNADIMTRTFNSETTTERAITTENTLETTTQAGIETTTVTLLNEIKSNDQITITSQTNVASQPIIPKKDYVIFGILPNNTVVRKDPNDNVLETLTETKQIRTEKPNDGQGNTVFKFIPIDEITVPPQETNVLTLASTKAPVKPNNEKEVQIVTPISMMEINSPTPEIQISLKNADELTTTAQPTVETPDVLTLSNNIQSTMTTLTTNPITTVQPMIESTTSNLRTTFNSVENTKTITTTAKNVITTLEPTTERYIPEMLTTLTTTSMPLFTNIPITTESVPVPNNSMFPTTEMTRTTTADIQSNNNKNQENANVLQMLQSILSTNTKTSSSQDTDQMKLLQALLLGAKDNVKDKQKSPQTTTVRSIQDEIRQFEEDTKFLKALLQATGRDPADFNIPSIDDIKPTLGATTTNTPTTTTMITTTTQASPPTTTPVIKSTTSIAEDLKKIQEDTLLLQALLKATGQTVDTINMPVISGITSNVRVASNPLTTSIESNPTTPMNIRPIYTTIQPTEKTTVQTNAPQTVSTLSTLQEQQSTVKEDIGISTTYRPVQRRFTTTTTPPEIFSTLSARRAPSLAQVTTEVPSTSTFSVEEDLAFLNNLKTVLNTNNSDDPEAALANRVIALAVERSLNELQSSSTPNVVNSVRTTRPTTTTTTTTMTTTTVYTPPVSTQSTPSIEDDIKQFEEDTKLLQALLKATGQDPSKFNIPTLPSVNKPNKDNQASVMASLKPTTKPFGVKIAVKDELKNVQDDAQLLQTLIKLKDAQETTTQRNKIAITGQSSDEALQKLIQKAKPTAMVSEATKSSVSLSTEYGNSNDALLAALLKEQGFGPTTASSLDEQVRLAALLNQVVVTPKARRTTTPPPPPPAPRRPILDGLAWLWQQWRDTAPGTGGAGSAAGAAGAGGAGGSRTNNRRPAPAPAHAPAPRPTAAATPAPSRVNWFGSGPFVGNADDRPASNRIPLEPPRAVAAEQAPGRGQLVSAAINVTRAFSQFLGAAIQGAAQTVQNVIRAGQKAATDVYTNGSG
ncbi:PREDICTED: mucin-5AC-like isoform X8 [Papilio xuthus]|uniref:Mucin-5AC-like isoform X8 n=1 Tax=Papilio xuthus TaxID=66420 RepID=A0AAJ6YYW3_PAPXU|nr:PREDICTED: mucin-5AC-like isoform X8 [Papilio xuthus]